MTSKNFDYDPILQWILTNKVDLRVFAHTVIKGEFSWVQIKKKKLTSQAEFCGYNGKSTIRSEQSRENRDLCDY
jgi:hypothetical protein